MSSWGLEMCTECTEWQGCVLGIFRGTNRIQDTFLGIQSRPKGPYGLDSSVIFCCLCSYNVIYCECSKEGL